MNIMLIFCSNCQSETAHDLSINTVDDDELVAVCPVCRRALKFPANMTSEDFKLLLDAHKEANQGQQPVEVVAEPVTPAPDSEPEAPVIDPSAEPAGEVVTPQPEADPSATPLIEESPHAAPEPPAPVLP